jgi:6-phosphogluconolactonase
VTDLIAYVGSYPDSPNPGGGGITVLAVDMARRRLTTLGHQPQPGLAGHLALAPGLRTLYAVDERKTDGRGPVQPAAALHALRVERDGLLTWLNSLDLPGPRPTYVTVDGARRRVLTANHGDFEHVERVVRSAEGTWTVQYVYDDSTVVLCALDDDGRLEEIRDVHVRTGHGSDPNRSPQNGGHAQSSAHAHCAVIDPSGQYIVVCDKGTDEIVVLSHTERLDQISTFAMPNESGPRHLVFDPRSDLAFATLEFASELASLKFDAETGQFRLLDRAPTVARDLNGRVNEPADVQLHPTRPFVYVNNRGEDSVAWFRFDPDGNLTRLGDTALAPSIHPGLAARSLCFDHIGSLMLVADRPANLVRAYTIDAETGEPREFAHTAVINPACVIVGDHMA